MPKTFKFSFLEKNNQTELSEKENELLYRYFKYKNIDELVTAFKNTKTDKELDELFDKIVNRLKIFKKLIDTVPNITEKKRINNVMNSIEFVLNDVASDKNVSYSNSKQDFSDSEFSDSDSDSKQDFFNFDSNTKGSGLKILTPNQILSRLPITLAQLKAGNNSQKLINQIRQLLYSLYRYITL